MKYYILYILILIFYSDNLICQEKLNYKPLDSLVTSCMKNHIDFLQQENHLSKGDKLYFKNNDFSKLTFSQWNGITVEKVNYKDVYNLTKHNRSIRLFYIYPEFINNKIILNVILLSSKRKRKHYTDLNFSTGIFEIDFDCNKNSYYYKVVKQYQGGEW